MKPPVRHRGLSSVIALFALGLGALLSTGAQATPIPAVSMTGGTLRPIVPVGGITEGWRFTLTSDVSVTDLGYFDFNTNGLAESHAVGIFSDTGILLFSATVTTADVLDGWFRYAAITPQTLAAGTYRIGGYRATGSDFALIEAVGLATATGVGYLGGYFNVGGTLAFPNAAVLSGANPSMFGPNFRFEAATAGVPAPATLTLMGLGLAGVGYGRGRHRKAA